MDSSFGESWILAKPNKLYYYKEVPLFHKTSNGMVVYKPKGVRIPKDKIENQKVPRYLYVRYQDRLKAFEELNEAYRKEISEVLDRGDIFEIQKNVKEIAEELFEDPRRGTALLSKGVVSAITKRCLQDKKTLDIFKRFKETDYTTIVHSVHVMTLTMQFGIYKDYEEGELESISMSALLHDIGKAYVPDYILYAPRELTIAEFDKMKEHPKNGHDVLWELGLKKAAKVALRHHERNDKSGYPYGLEGTQIDRDSQLIAIIDAYESMTSDNRIYRPAKSPYEALKILRNEVDEGKFDFELFSDFARSLVKVN